MEFYFPINGFLLVNILDTLARKYDPLSNTCSPPNFYQINGILKGFIDLVFRYNGYYYLLDYKFNWLRENSENYTSEAIATVMCSHRYDLQYQIYTLVLHRYLRYCILDYCYETYFSGIIYLFLRGINTKTLDPDILTTRPAKALIKRMDHLFANNTQEIMQL